MKNVPISQRTARFICAIALAEPGQPTWTTSGIHEGLVLLKEQGDQGFGYDSLFFSPELQASFAEVPVVDKNRVSHRARALEQVRSFLAQRGK
jgi:XTP/dITP diphosphohydrolase